LSILGFDKEWESMCFNSVHMFYTDTNMGFGIIKSELCK